MSSSTPHPIPYQGSKRNLATRILSFSPDDAVRLIEPDKSDPRWSAIDAAAFRSKNLYNAANYRVRQEYIFNQRFIPYATLDKLMKRNPDYCALPRKVSQWVLKQVDHDWQAYFAALNEWEAHPEKFRGRPRLPKYKPIADGRNLLTYTVQVAGQRIFKKKGVLQPSGLDITIQTQQYNKQRAHLQSQLPAERQHSRRLDALATRCNRRVSAYLHLASRRIIDALIQHRIGEGYTSKCSFLDNEPIEKRAVYAGKRLHRGLFRARDGRLINADANGAYNILRKAIPNAFGNGIEGAVVHPVQLRLYKTDPPVSRKGIEKGTMLHSDRKRINIA